MVKSLFSTAFLLFFTFSVFSAERRTPVNKEFNMHKPEVLKFINTIKPSLKNVVNILKQINSKADLIDKRSSLVNELKNLILKTKSINKLTRTINKKKRFAFLFWMLSLDKEYTALAISVRKEKKRIEKLPGCKPILKDIDKEFKIYRKKLKNS
jgi:hypothetical protein